MAEKKDKKYKVVYRAKSVREVHHNCGECHTTYGTIMQRIKIPIYEAPKLTFDEHKKKRISEYCAKHGLDEKTVTDVLERYIAIYPEEEQSAGFRNVSNRFLDKVMSATLPKAEKTPAEALKLPQEAETTKTATNEGTRNFDGLQYEITEEELTAKVKGFCMKYSVTSEELQEVIKAYLQRYPDKVGSNGQTHLSDRFIRACLRNDSVISDRLAKQGIEI